MINKANPAIINPIDAGIDSIEKEINESIKQAAILEVILEIFFAKAMIRVKKLPISKAKIHDVIKTLKKSKVCIEIKENIFPRNIDAKKIKEQITAIIISLLFLAIFIVPFESFQKEQNKTGTFLRAVINLFSPCVPFIA